MKIHAIRWSLIDFSRKTKKLTRKRSNVIVFIVCLMLLPFRDRWKICHFFVFFLVEFVCSDSDSFRCLTIKHRHSFGRGANDEHAHTSNMILFTIQMMLKQKRHSNFGVRADMCVCWYAFHIRVFIKKMILFFWSGDNMVVNLYSKFVTQLWEPNRNTKIFETLFWMLVEMCGVRILICEMFDEAPKTWKRLC